MDIIVYYNMQYNKLTFIIYNIVLRKLLLLNIYGLMGIWGIFKLKYFTILYCT